MGGIISSDTADARLIIGVKMKYRVIEEKVKYPYQKC